VAADQSDQPQVMFGPLPPQTEAYVRERLSALGAYAGSLQAIVGGGVRFDDPPVHVTVDYYIDGSGVTHVVVGAMSGDGSYWEILSDTPIPTVPPSG
jgi:hypothetical protein